MHHVAIGDGGLVQRTGLAVLHHTTRWADLAPDDADLVDFLTPRG